MRKKKTSPDKHSERPSKKLKDVKPEKRQPDPDDPYEETGPPIKERSITGGRHNEQNLDRKPE